MAQGMIIVGTVLIDIGAVCCSRFIGAKISDEAPDIASNNDKATSSITSSESGLGNLLDPDGPWIGSASGGVNYLSIHGEVAGVDPT